MKIQIVRCPANGTLGQDSDTSKRINFLDERRVNMSRVERRIESVNRPSADRSGAMLDNCFPSEMSLLSANALCNYIAKEYFNSSSLQCRLYYRGLHDIYKVVAYN